MPEPLAVTLPLPPNPVGPVIDGLGGALGGGARAAGQSVLASAGEAIARGLADACKQVTHGLLSMLSASGGIDLQAGWWTSDRTQNLLRSVLTLAGVLMVGFLLLAVIQGVLAGEPASMLRAVAVEAPVSVLGMVLLVAVTQLLLGLTDAASAMVLQGAPGDLGHFLSGFGSSATVATGGVAAAVMLVVFLLGALLVWIELVVRSALIYLLVAFAPLALAARVWPAAKGVFRRLCELGLALIVAKFGIALALGLGAAALAGGGASTSAGAAADAGADLAGLLGGATLMLLAAFMPFVVLRLLPILETAVVAQGISRAPVRAGQGGLQASYYAQGLSRLAGGKGGGSRGPATGGESGGAPSVAPGPTGAPSPGPGPGAGGTGASAGGGSAAGGAAAGAAAVAVPVGVVSKTAQVARDRASAVAEAPAAAPGRHEERRGESRS